MPQEQHECRQHGQFLELSKFMGRIDESVGNLKDDINHLFAGQRELQRTIEERLPKKNGNGNGGALKEKINFKGIGILIGTAIGTIVMIILGYLGVKGG